MKTQLQIWVPKVNLVAKTPWVDNRHHSLVLVGHAHKGVCPPKKPSLCQGSKRNNYNYRLQKDFKCPRYSDLRDKNSCMHKLFFDLQEVPYVLQHIHSEDNKILDALSCAPNESEHFSESEDRTEEDMRLAAKIFIVISNNRYKHLWLLRRSGPYWNNEGNKWRWWLPKNHKGTDKWKQRSRGNAGSCKNMSLASPEGLVIFDRVKLTSFQPMSIIHMFQYVGKHCQYL